MLGLMECNICLDNITGMMVYTNCSCKNKVFHKICLDKWLLLSRTCPYCKHSFSGPPGKYTNEKSMLDKALYLDSIHRYPVLIHDGETINRLFSNFSIPLHL